MPNPSILKSLLFSCELLILPGVYDALSAKIAEYSGFKAICAGGFSATASLLAEPDIGQLSMRDYVDHYGRITSAIDVPILVDADTGFGGVNQILNAVRAFEKADIGGMFFEDQSFPKRCGYLAGKDVVPAEVMAAKIRAAVAARIDPDFVVIARTDALRIEGIDAAIERARLYTEAGADMTFVQGADEPEVLARICRDVPCPQLANISAASGKKPLGFDEIASAGASGVIVPNVAMLAAAQAVSGVMESMRHGTSLQNLTTETMLLPRYMEIVGLAEREAFETAHRVV